MDIQQKIGTALQLAKAFGSDRKSANLAWRVRAERLSYLDYAALLDLYARVVQIELDGLQGQMLEMGAALGGSTVMLANAKKPERELLVFDTFSTIPPPTENDSEDAHARYEAISGGEAVGIKGDTYYGYQGDLRPRVADTLARYGTPVDANQIALVQGLYEDTLKVSAPVAFAHIDCDWYDSVTVCLTRVVPQLVAGGVLVIDDYYDWDGCRRAVDDYFADKRDAFRFEQKSRLHILRR